MTQVTPVSTVDSLLLPSHIKSSSVAPVLKLVSITQAELTKLKWEGNYWKAQHQRSCKREERLKKELEQKDALIRDLNHRLFGKKSETGGNPRQTVEQQPSKTAKRPRGQQPESRGHGRIQRLDLPIVVEKHELDGKCCSQCNLPYRPFPGDEESDIIEIEVKPYRRRICRNRYAKSCSCPPSANSPTIIVAPTPPRVIPKSPYGVSVWAHILLGKFLYSQPLNRIINELNGYGLPLSSGTMTGGLRKIAELFVPLKLALYERQMSEVRFHNDESRWKVFAATEGKVGYDWYLWVTRSPEVIYHQIAPTRSTVVPLAHFSGLEAAKVILVCDRYSVYKMLARLNSAIILAFCWAHVRRDFLEAANGFPTVKEWALDWVEEIGTLYHLNHQRLAHWQEALPLAQQNELFQVEQKRLEHRVEQMKERCNLLLQADLLATRSPRPTDKKGKIIPGLRPGELHSEQRKVLVSLQNHWHGLIVFITHPEVPMDNNFAEQAIRHPVVGRNNYYGSGSIWSAELAAMMFSLFQTLGLWDINTHHWLQEYLTACAKNGGAAPSDLTPFLPWCMNEEQRLQLAKAPPRSRNTS